MNSVNNTKKKISEYQVEDLKEIFIDIIKKISSKVILLEIGNDFLRSSRRDLMPASQASTVSSSYP